MASLSCSCSVLSSSHTTKPLHRLPSRHRAVTHFRTPRIPQTAQRCKSLRILNQSPVEEEDKGQLQSQASSTSWEAQSEQRESLPASSSSPLRTSNSSPKMGTSNLSSQMLSPSSSQTRASGGGQRTPPDHPELPYSALTFFSLIGALETAYLTYEKLYGGPLTCPFGGSCNDVLDSSYGSLLGIPLSLYGFLSYSSIALMTQISRTNTKRGILRDNVRWLLLGLATAMCGVSAFLLYVIKFELDSAFCAYCIGSAGLSGLLLFLSFQGFSGEEIKKAVVPQSGLVAATIISLSLAFGDASVQEIDLPPIEPEVTTVSTSFETLLAKHLASVGAKMYGAFWCSHCYDQKQAFGQEAAKVLPYVECYPDGYRRGVKIASACEEAKIEGFPTWIINGEMRPGDQDLTELARLTGFDMKSAQ